MKARFLTLTRLDQVLIVYVFVTIIYVVLREQFNVREPLLAIAFPLALLAACWSIVSISEDEKHELAHDALSLMAVAAPACLAIVLSHPPKQGANPISTFLLLILIAPWIEELVYRGMLLRPYLDDEAFTRRAVGAACFFALVQPLMRFVPAFLLGLSLALIYKRYRSLWPCTLVPIAFNLALLFEPQ